MIIKTIIKKIKIPTLQQILVTAVVINAYRKQITYTPYGLTYLNIDRNKLPSYIESAYSVFDKEEFVQIPYIKGRASEEIEKLIDDEVKKL